jgi:predicted  nucleic acid-binding Zn-ribbon protein
MTLPETSWPNIAAAIVGSIGLLGIFAGIVACRRVSAEAKTLDRGEDALTDSLSTLTPDSTDPVEWLASKDLSKDSHFGDHLLSVWCGWLGERLPTLAELHSLSARRERRRLSARISGGITALLLICGIAGTLLCIHPILNSFTILRDADGNVIIDPSVAQELIRSLGSAFLPSLTALAFTVLVAIFRGTYTQATTGLAWRLDRFAVAQLFPMFKPKRFGSELTEVHLKLSRLVDRLEERNEKFGEGVETFGQAAIDIKEAGPKLKAASDRITNAADRLASETETMTKALENCLGEDSPLVRVNTSLKEILDACQETAKELRKGSTALATSVAGMSSKFEESRTQLDTLIADIPSKIQQGCNAGNKALLDAAGTLEQANEVAGIPSNIEDGCNLGIKALTEVNQKAANGAADTIARAAESATAGIKSAVSNAQKDIQKSCVDAGEDYKSKAKDASIQAAAVFREASIAAAKIIKDEVDPIKQVTAEMRKKLTDTIESVANGGKARPPVATLKRKLWKRVLSLGILK